MFTMMQIGSAPTERGERMMPDKEKVIKGLNHCFHGQEFCDEIECPYYIEQNSCYLEECQKNLKEDVLSMLKEQEAVKPGKDNDGTPEPYTAWWYVCGSCSWPIDMTDRYCRRCGRSVKWDD